MTQDHPEPPKPPPTLLELYGTGAEMIYRYRIEIEQGSAHRRALAEVLADMDRKRK